MLRRRYYLFLHSLLIFVFSYSMASGTVDEINLAENLIAQNDCENALPVLVSAFKKSGTDKKKLLLSINHCAEKTLNYPLKKNSESKLLQIEPHNQDIQLRYLDSLFYLSHYNELISFSKKNNKLMAYDEYWLLVGRSFYEINQNEKSIEVLMSYLSQKKTIKKQDEAYYWLAKNHLQLENYSLAKNFAIKLSEQNIASEWLRNQSRSLLDLIEAKDKRFFYLTRIQTGYDSNILKTNSKKADLVTFFDTYLDYQLINKKNNSLTLGLDINIQIFSKYNSDQISSYFPRISQKLVPSKRLSIEYLAGLGKSQINFKKDQDFFYFSNQYYIFITNDIELQPSISYFQNINNNPVKEYNLSLFMNFYLKNSFFWLGPYTKESSSPEPIIDSTNFVYPVVINYSLITRYNQVGLLLGYQHHLNDKLSILGQFSIYERRFSPINLTPYNATQVSDFNARLDTNHSLKMSINYRYSSPIKYFLTTSYVKNYSKGFQGFNSPATPTNNYDQMQFLLGLSYYGP